MLLVVRPLAGALSLIRADGTRGERAAVAFFGVRGIGSIYYVAFALAAADFAEEGRLYGTVALVVAGSVLLHGVTAAPVMNRLDRLRDLVPRDEQPSATPGVPTTN